MSATTDQLALRLRQDINQAEDWMRTLLALHHQSRLRLATPTTLTNEINLLATFRARAMSTLLNVALLGEFSSGKSFLVSGLQSRLRVERIRSGGTVGDKFIGLLPSSPKPTTSCPATVVPIEPSDEQPTVDDSQTLRVRFTDTDEWEDIGSATSPIVVAAYATELVDFVEARRESDRARQVAEIEILLRHAPLPAKLYDLPGQNAPSRIHDAIVRARMQEADCFIYVTRAQSTLSEAELDLIRFVYQHHRSSEKPVVWVVTGIDLAQDLGMDNRPKWVATVEQNNAYLADNFRLTDERPDVRFIGDGFIAVSPALEARARALEDTDREKAREDAATSRMEELRRVLLNMIEAGSGRRHLGLVAAEAAEIIARRQRELSNLLETERIPYDKLVAERSDLRRRIAAMEEHLVSVRSRLSESLDRRVKAASQPFVSGGLRSYLHAELDRSIQQADLRKQRAVNELEVKRLQVTKAWIEADRGPVRLWDEELGGLKSEALAVVQQALESGRPPGDLRPAASIDVETLTAPRTNRTREEGEDIMEKAVGIAASVAPLAGSVVAVVGAATAAAFLLVPVGIGVTAAGVYGMVRARRRKYTVLDHMREDEMASLDNSADEASSWFRVTASQVGIDLVERACELVANRRDELAGSLLRVEERLVEPQSVDRQRFLGHLETMCRDGERLLDSLIAQRGSLGA